VEGCQGCQAGTTLASVQCRHWGVHGCTEALASNVSHTVSAIIAPWGWIQSPLWGWIFLVGALKCTGRRIATVKRDSTNGYHIISIFNQLRRRLYQFHPPEKKQLEHYSTRGAHCDQVLSD